MEPVELESAKPISTPNRFELKRTGPSLISGCTRTEPEPPELKQQEPTCLETRREPKRPNQTAPTHEPCKPREPLEPNRLEPWEPDEPNHANSASRTEPKVCAYACVRVCDRAPRFYPFQRGDSKQSSCPDC